jgi:hypothetical protein
MIRRLANALLLVAGGGSLAVAAERAGLEGRVLLGLAGLAVVGGGLNMVGLAAGRLNLRPWLRVLAALVGLAVLTGLLAMLRLTRQTLSSLSASNIEGRAYLSRSLHDTLWLAIGLAYVLVSLAVLPPAAEPEGRHGGAGGPSEELK